MTNAGLIRQGDTVTHHGRKAVVVSVSVNSKHPEWIQIMPEGASAYECVDRREIEPEERQRK